MDLLDTDTKDRINISSLDDELLDNNVDNEEDNVKRPTTDLIITSDDDQVLNFDFEHMSSDNDVTKFISGNDVKRDTEPCTQDEILIAKRRIVR